MAKPLGDICRASLATMCLLSTCSGQTARVPVQSASTVVQQFENTRVFWKQFEVARKIVALGDKSVLKELEPWLHKEDRHVRGNAAFIFAGLGDDRGFEVIKGTLFDRTARPPAQGIWFVEGSEEAIRASLPLQQIATDRYYAAHLFGDLKDARAVPILVPLLSDKEVRDIIPWSLGEIGDKSAIPPLIEMLGDSSPDMRVLAIYALQKLKAKEALPQLRALLDDNERIHFDGLGTVAEAARAAIASF